jgi:hypothetical protein
LGSERCGKINALNSFSESWTGIGVVAGGAVVVLILPGPYMKQGIRIGESHFFIYYKKLGISAKLATTKYFDSTGRQWTPALALPHGRSGCASC